MEGKRRYAVHLAKPSDAKDIVDFLNACGGESDHISFGKNEYKFSAKDVEEKIAKTENDKTGVRIVIREDETEEVIATGSATSNGKRSQHVFALGVVVRKKNWRQGIGKLIMTRLENDVKNVRVVRESLWLLGAEKMVLAVKADNFSAIRLYEAMGYIEEGRLKREIKLGLEYIDLILMAKMLV